MDRDILGANTNSGEKVVFKTGLLWVDLMRPIVFVVGSVSFAACTCFMNLSKVQIGNNAVESVRALSNISIASVCVVTLALMTFIIAFAVHSLSEVVLTDQRLIKKSGMFSSEIYIDKIDSMAMKKRLFTNTMVVFSTGGKAQRFDNIKDINLLRDNIAQQIEKRSQRRR